MNIVLKHLYLLILISLLRQASSPIFHFLCRGSERDAAEELTHSTSKIKEKNLGDFCFRDITMFARSTSSTVVGETVYSKKPSTVHLPAEVCSLGDSDPASRQEQKSFAWNKIAPWA